jgi:DNA-binding transcriptional MerR regulator
LQAVDLDVSPRQIERWLQAGLIEESDRRWIPREGSESAYGPEALKQAREVKTLLDQGLTLEQIAIVQFLRSRYVITPALKQGLSQQLFESLGAGVDAMNWTQAEPVAEARAEHIARRLARQSEAKSLRQQLHRLAGRAGERINEAVARVIAGALMPYLAGEPRTRRELTALLKALGLPTEHLSMNEIVANLPLLRIEALSQQLQVARARN